MSEMIVIPPISVTETILTSSNIPEPDTGDYAEYNNATAYVIGNKATVSTVEPNIHKNYECIANTTGNAPWLDVTEEDIRNNNFVGDYWAYIGPTNRWKMFDVGVATQSEYADEIDVTLEPGQLTNSLALINVSAATVQVIVTDPTDGEIYNRTISMVSTSGITDWYAYFFTPIERRRDLVLLDLPAYSTAEVRIILTDTGSTVKLGALILGNLKKLGTAEHGTSVGIQDFSTKETDTFGNFIIIERPFSKKANYVVDMPTPRTDYVLNYLASLRGTACVWVGSEDLGATIIYGFYKDLDIILSGPISSKCNLKVEGLTQ